MTYQKYPRLGLSGPGKQRPPCPHWGGTVHTSHSGYGLSGHWGSGDSGHSVKQTEDDTHTGGNKLIYHGHNNYEHNFSNFTIK